MQLVDTSVLLAAVLNEPRAGLAQDWLSSRDDLHTLRWSLTEAMSALSIKVRARMITAEERAIAAGQVRGLLASVLTAVELEPQHFLTAATWCEQVALRLRGPDALHLAVATQSGATLWTFDEGQIRAGEALGLDARLLA